VTSVRPASQKMPTQERFRWGSSVADGRTHPCSRVLYVSYDGVLEPLGQSQVLPYLEGLSREGVTFTLLTFEKGPDTRPGSPAFERTRARLAATGIRWHPLRYHKRPALLSTLYDIVRGAVSGLYLARRQGTQVVHARSYVPAMMALPVRWLLRCPLLFDIRGFWVDERVEGGIWRKGFVYRIATLVERLLYRNADAIVSLTEAGKLAVQDFPAVSRRGIPIEVVPTCVDTEHFAPRKPDRALIERLGFEEKTVFTYVGSVGTWYAMDEVLDFFGVVLQEIPEAALLLVVRGPLDALRRSVELRGILNVTAIVSSVPHGEIPRWLAVSRVGLAFYRPGVSNIARFPTKIGEYLASGLPSVVSGGIGDCDRILEGERVGVSVGEFTRPEYRRAARALRELLMDDSLSERCRRVALLRLSAVEGVKRYRAVYRRLAGEEAPPVGTTGGASCPP